MSSRTPPGGRRGDGRRTGSAGGGAARGGAAAGGPPRGGSRPTPARRAGGTTSRTASGRGAGADNRDRGAPTNRRSPAGTGPGPAARGSAGGRRAPGRRAGQADEPADRSNRGKGLGGEQVEGRQAVRELLIAGRRRVKEILLPADLEDAPILEDIAELAEDRRVPLRRIGRGKFDSLASTSAAQGVIARAQGLPEYDLDELAKRRRPTPAFLIALDGVTDPGNLGAVLRSAEGAGVTGVVLPRHRAVHVTPAVAKAAAGAIEYVPMSLVGGLPTALARLTELGVWVVGMDGSAERSLADLPVHDEPVCLVFGAEGKGLSRLVRQRCQALASIPLRGQLNSLNVAAAAAVACFDIARRRGESQG